MEFETVFYPPRRKGLFIHILVATGMLVGGGLSFWQSLQGEVGTRFILLLLASAVLLAPLPLVIYRAYALSRANYQMDRDSLRLRWGLRIEEIPLPEVEWIRPASEMGFRFPLPGWSVPGAILGIRHIEGLGKVEFIASDVKTMLLVATTRSIYAISPANLKTFESSFYRSIELGSLTQVTPSSTLPVAFAQRIWKDRAARVMMTLGLSLVGILFLLAAYLISARSSISLGYHANLKPLDPGPPEHLLLLPVLGGFIYVVDLLAGIFYYRREEKHLVAYMLWAGCILSPLLILIGLLLI